MTNADKDDFPADSSPANDNDSNKAPVTVTSAAGALASVSLAALKLALNGVDTMSGGRSEHPTMLFKARQGDGTYMFGTKQTVPEEGSRWAFNPTMIQRGYVCFGDGGKKLGERLLPITQPMLDPATLPDRGFPWVEQWAVSMKCLSGIDAGVETIFKTTTFGGIQAVRDFLLGAIRDRHQWRPARRQGGADRAPGKGRLQKRVRPATESGLPNRRLDGAERSGSSVAAPLDNGTRPATSTARRLTPMRT